MFFELRQYPVFEGKLEAFAKFMDETVIPFQLSKGMVVMGSYTDVPNNRYIWIRRFESEEEKEALYTAVYQSDYWRNEMSPQVGEYIDRSGIVVDILTATPRSVMQ